MFNVCCTDDHTKQFNKANLSNLIPAAKREFQLLEVINLVLGYFLKTPNFSTKALLQPSVVNGRIDKHKAFVY